MSEDAKKAIEQQIKDQVIDKNESQSKAPPPKWASDKPKDSKSVIKTDKQNDKSKFITSKQYDSFQKSFVFNSDGEIEKIRYTDPNDESNFVHFSIDSDGNVSKVSSADDLESSAKEQMIKEQLDDDVCEIDDEDCIVEQAVDTYLMYDMTIPGENQAQEELEEAIKQINIKSGVEEEKKELDDFEPPKYF